VVDPVLLETWNERLSELGARVVLRRAEILDELRSPFSEMHGRIAQDSEVGIRMRSIGGESRDHEEIRSRIIEQLASSRSEELRRQMVLVGPQRDDLIMELDGRSARNFASQGQARSLVLAFKLAELQAAQARGDHPVFLLDDLTSELDRGRMNRLIGILGDLEGQVWLSTTDPNWLGPLPAERTVVKEVPRRMVEAL
jgi:DNA replication and repair protein RecF